MSLQNYERKSQQIRQRFLELKAESPERFRRRLAFAWSNWGFGLEPLADSARRLQRAGIAYIELHGNRYGADLGYRAPDAKAVLQEHGLKVAGICGMFSADNDLSSPRGVVRQNAIDYIRRNVALGHDLGATYMLIVPGAVGRPQKADDTEFERSVESLRRVADVFVEAGIQAAIEPIRAAEVSFCHTVADAVDYIAAVNHPGVQHINGDVYHMQSEESHIGEAIVDCGERLVNLHLADSNRRALGDGAMDLDTIIMALYVIGYNREGCFVTAEPLGPGGDPYPAMHGKPDAAALDKMVLDSVTYFRAREEVVLSLESLSPVAVAPDTETRQAEDDSEDQAGLDHLHIEFWKQLLERAKARTSLHARISPSKAHWISTSAGRNGLSWNYVIKLRDARVELFFIRPDTKWNKAAYDSLLAHKAEVETRMGAALRWQRLDDKQACRISYGIVTRGGLAEPNTWPELQDAMIDAMIRLEKALRPEIERLPV